LRTAGKYISIAQLLVLSFYLSPKYYIHGLYSHEDTHCHAGASTSLEPQHHHCKILQLSEAVFLIEKPILISFHAALFPILSEALFTCFQPEDYEFIQLRAPPANSIA
jgi:hypothetical protein